MNYRFTDLDEQPISITMTIGELKQLAKVLRGLSEEHDSYYFARNRARECEEMVRKAGDAMSLWAADYAKFGREND